MVDDVLGCVADPVLIELLGEGNKFVPFARFHSHERNKGISTLLRYPLQQALRLLSELDGGPQGCKGKLASVPQILLPPWT